MEQLGVGAFRILYPVVRSSAVVPSTDELVSVETHEAVDRHHRDLPTRLLSKQQPAATEQFPAGRGIARLDARVHRLSLRRRTGMFCYITSYYTFYVGILLRESYVICMLIQNKTRLL
jgi:hypothetical protein